MGLPTSKFCSTVFHERGLKKRFDDHVSSTCCSSVSGDGAGLWTRGVGRGSVGWDSVFFERLGFSFAQFGDAANTIQ